MQIPTLQTIRSSSGNGLKVVSTFSGCGGSCLGYRMAGCKVIWANEFVPLAQNVYQRNHSQSFLNTQDIRQISAEQIQAEARIDGRDIDIFDGSPPCASFSTIGKRERGWGKINAYSGKHQQTDDLFYEYIRLLKTLQPKSFVAENVPGLVRGTAKGYFINIFKAMRDCGYDVQCQLVNASWVGAATSRERVIFIGVRNDLSRKARHPKPFGRQIGFNEAIENIAPTDPEANEFRWLKSGSQMRRYWEHTRLGHTFEYAAKTITGKGKAFQWYRIHPFLPIPTVVQGSQCITHFKEPRTLSIAEIKACSGFPADFVFQGGFSEKWERIGRAVPPLMMKAIASAIAETLV